MGKTNVLKKNLRQFDGFDFKNGSPEFKKRVEASQKLELPKLKAVCEGLQLDKKGPKDAICQRIVEFLIAPHSIERSDDEDEDDDEDASEGMCAFFSSDLLSNVNQFLNSAFRRR